MAGPASVQTADKTYNRGRLLDKAPEYAHQQAIAKNRHDSHVKGIHMQPKVGVQGFQSRIINYWSRPRWSRKFLYSLRIIIKVDVHLPARARGGSRRPEIRKHKPASISAKT